MIFLLCKTDFFSGLLTDIGIDLGINTWGIYELTKEGKNIQIRSM